MESFASFVMGSAALTEDEKYQILQNDEGFDLVMMQELNMVELRQELDIPKGLVTKLHRALRPSVNQSASANNQFNVVVDPGSSTKPLQVSIPDNLQTKSSTCERIRNTFRSLLCFRWYPGFSPLSFFNVLLSSIRSPG